MHAGHTLPPPAHYPTQSPRLAGEAAAWVDDEGNQWGRDSLLAVWAAASWGLCWSPGTSQRCFCSPDLELLQAQLREDNSLGRRRTRERRSHWEASARRRLHR